MSCWAGASPARGAWLDLDPTNNLVPGTRHVRLAVGRDFGDVTPLCGVIRGGGEHRLKVGVATRALQPGQSWALADVPTGAPSALHPSAPAGTNG